MSLVVEYQKKRPAATGRLATQDIENIQTVATYLSDHYAAEVPMERLTQIACMGTTKLKSSFKKVYDCTITEYIQQRRMSQAEYLLTNTDLSIGPDCADCGLFYLQPLCGAVPKEHWTVTGRV
mgnify:CR=1 FL=1